jgi:transposase InsO family protein
MPWKERSAMSLKLEFVSFAQQEAANIRGLCRRFGVSPATAYKWLRRFQESGVAGLAEGSRRPLHSPLTTPDAVAAQILATAHQHPAWGARKLKHLLEAQGHVIPAVSTVHAILQRNGLHVTSAKGSESVGRFEHEAPNQLWQMDFKGHFETGAGRSHPLTILDDHSRFLLCLHHSADERRQSVQTQLVRVFETYGLPERMSMDNGAPWGDTTGTFTGLELWLMRQGIRVGHSRPYHPQTQGKLERLHRSLKAELLQGRWFPDAQQIQLAFDGWRQIYNLERPHESLEMHTPASCYQPSARCYCAHPAPPEYDVSMAVRRVDVNGRLSFKGQKLTIGKAFIREHLGIREETEDAYSLWWYSSKIGTVNLKSLDINIGKTR